jgi:hypothetical protein
MVPQHPQLILPQPFALDPVDSGDAHHMVIDMLGRPRPTKGKEHYLERAAFGKML